MLEESSTYQLIFRRGELRGIRKALLQQATQRFGPPTASHAAVLERIDDLERLERILNSVFELSCWPDLLNVL